MTARPLGFFLLAVASLISVRPLHAASGPDEQGHEFRTSDRCVACHNDLKLKNGEDVSFGFLWSASVMANSSRDPYWQGSVRRETIDHPESSSEIQNECSTCHMPMLHLQDRDDGRKTDVFGHLPVTAQHEHEAEAADGVSCSVCHQIAGTGLGTPETFSGNVAISAPNAKEHHPEFGPFLVDQPHQTVMVSSTAGFVPTQAGHMRDSGLCGSCHTLYTIARGPGGKEIGKFPEQMPYLEWAHSDYYNKQSCQECHMPKVDQPTRISSVYGPLREGMHEHTFVGGNVLLERVLNDHRGELGVSALPEELQEAHDRTTKFLQTQSARVRIDSLQAANNEVVFDVAVQNLTGHKLPTAYPSRRVWLHVVVRDQHGKKIFESGALNSDGSITGNDNDADPLRYEPHYTEITSPEQVQIFEPILKDQDGKVTTGLISAVGYLKDNRLLPSGFDKKTAGSDIAVIGKAAEDPNFTDKGSITRYRVTTAGAEGAFHVEAELWYQPVGFRWAHNLGSYKAMEPQRWVNYYESEAAHSAVQLAAAGATR